MRRSSLPSGSWRSPGRGRRPAATRPSSLRASAAGRGIPSPAGVLGGVGEAGAAGVAALEPTAAPPRRHGHVREVIVQTFLPKGGTAMPGAPACPEDEYLDAIALARTILPG